MKFKIISNNTNNLQVIEWILVLYIDLRPSWAVKIGNAPM